MKKSKKRTKPASKAQKRARERNWNKGQVLCIRAIALGIHRGKTTHLDERLILNDIIYKLDKILQNWKK